MKTHCISLLILTLACSGCYYEDSLEEILDEGELRVITRNGPTTYYEDRAGAAGFEYALATLFAQDLGVQLHIRSRFNIEAIFQSIDRGSSHLAAAGLSTTPGRIEDYSLSQSYREISSFVIYRAGAKRPRNVSHLVGKDVMVVANSSQVDTLEALRTEHPQLRWRVEPGLEALDLLQLVADESIDATIVDSDEFSAQRALFSSLGVGFTLTEPQEKVWLLLAGDENQRLLHRINSFFEKIENDGSLARLREEYFGHSLNVSQASSVTFARNMHRKLPKYRALIEEVAGEYLLDWEFLAAMSYQESHWNPLAKSPTGVRGMMMLTRNTASELGVDNRLDAGQSLRGGARYFNKIKRRLPDDILEPDRTWFTLAAYNIGLGHLEDGRVITERRGGDPDLWVDVKTSLPLLHSKKWYKTTRYGYARGKEAVSYVQNIRLYYNMLAWQEVATNRSKPPISIDQYVPETLRKTLSAL
ncbi:MAG: membrane-bound lytic murein transglycosylase F [Halieaceae bacterium]|jgi:membrane-bound lytic murein transglycosylase F